MFMSKHFYSGKKIENKSIFGTTTRHDGLRIQHLFYEEMCKFIHLSWRIGVLLPIHYKTFPLK